MINERILKLANFAQKRGYKAYRTRIKEDYRDNFNKLKYNFTESNTEIFKIMCNSEDAIVFPDEKITFTRTKENIPKYFDDKILKKEYKLKKGIRYDVIHNICPDYSILMGYGIEERLLEAKENLKIIIEKENKIFLFRCFNYFFSKIIKILNKFFNRKGISFIERLLNKIHNILILIFIRKNDKNRKIFYESSIMNMESLLSLAERYSKAAKAAGNTAIEEIMKNVPRFAPKNFHEALQSIRIVSSAFYLADNYQLGFGRLDQYLYPFYKNDIENGIINRDEAKNLLAEFFVSLNRDSDLYKGVQQGDNGQTIMLGGCKIDGTSAINELTYLIMETAKDLKLIDPKINLRIDSNTPMDLLELGCELTKCGLGFPQYSNDEVVIPALVKKGYSLEDARNYTVAACWEFIIPGKGLDVVNMGAVSFPAAVDTAFTKTLRKQFNIKNFKDNIKHEIDRQIKNIIKKRDIRPLPSSLVSLFMHNSLEEGIDVSKQAKYKNIGIHGAGASNGADSLTAIMEIFNKKGINGLKELQKAKENNFSGYEELRKFIINDLPKIGNNDERADKELAFLFNCFASSAKKFSKSNRVVRPGTGSSQYYIWLTESKKKNNWVIEPIVKATCDGRLEGEPLSSSLAPSHGIKVNGVLSVFKSFSNIDYSEIMNGGPITIELTPSVFSSSDGINKLAMLIKYFVELKNQQLQLNVLDVETLKDAIKNPDRHRNLIVRVWGWSGYFCELAPEYQQHIMKRHQYEL